jgi:hypothetical protein
MWMIPLSLEEKGKFWNKCQRIHIKHQGINIFATADVLLEYLSLVLEADSLRLLHIFKEVAKL